MKNKKPYYKASFFPYLSKNYFEWPEAKLILKLWTDEDTKILRKNLINFGNLGIEKTKWEIGNTTNTNKFYKMWERLGKLDEGRYKYLPGDALLRFMITLAKVYKMKTGKFKERQCKICRKKFLPAKKGDYAGNYSPLTEIYSFNTMPYCSYCIRESIGWSSQRLRIGKTKEEKEKALMLLKQFYRLVDFIPPNNYLSRDFIVRVFKNSTNKKRKEVMLFMKKLPMPDDYKTRFRSWFRTLIKARILETGARKMKRGTMLLAKDGHICFSLGEKHIDDWLRNNKIKHQKEIRYPKDPTLNPGGLLRTDWLVDNTYVEFIGMKGIKDYDKKILLKHDLIKSKKLNFIEIEPKDLLSLGEKFKNLKSAF